MISLKYRHDSLIKRTFVWVLRKKMPMHSGSAHEATLSIQSLAKNEKSRVLLVAFEHEYIGCHIIKSERPSDTMFLRGVLGSNVTQPAILGGFFACLE